jgi:hypothetical protein
MRTLNELETLTWAVVDLVERRLIRASQNAKARQKTYLPAPGCVELCRLFALHVGAQSRANADTRSALVFDLDQLADTTGTLGYRAVRSKRPEVFAGHVLCATPTARFWGRPNGRLRRQLRAYHQTQLGLYPRGRTPMRYVRTPPTIRPADRRRAYSIPMHWSYQDTVVPAAQARCRKSGRTPSNFHHPRRALSDQIGLAMECQLCIGLPRRICVTRSALPLS